MDSHCFWSVYNDNIRSCLVSAEAFDSSWLFPGLCTYVDAIVDRMTTWSICVIYWTCLQMFHTSMCIHWNAVRDGVFLVYQGEVSCKLSRALRCKGPYVVLYPRTDLHVSSFNDALIIIIKLKATGDFLVAVMLLFCILHKWLSEKESFILCFWGGEGVIPVNYFRTVN
jgi:hypothetical protein